MIFPKHKYYLLFGLFIFISKNYDQVFAQGTLVADTEEASFELNSISLDLLVKDKNLGIVPNNLSISVQSQTSGEVITSYNKPDTTTPIVLPIDDSYLILVEAENYESTSFEIGTTTFESYELKKTVILNSVLTEVEFNIQDIDTGDPITAVDIILTNKSRNETIKTHLESPVGKYIVNVRDNDKYEVSINTDGEFFYHTEKFSTEGEFFSIEVGMISLYPGNKILLEGIIFEKGQAVLNEQMYSELDRIVALFDKHPSLVLEVAGHTDDKGSEQENLELSELRVEAVLNYLIEEKKVPATLLQGKGYGESQPLVPNDSEENRAINRRFELIVLAI